MINGTNSQNLESSELGTSSEGRRRSADSRSVREHSTSLRAHLRAEIYRSEKPNRKLVREIIQAIENELSLSPRLEGTDEIDEMVDNPDDAVNEMDILKHSFCLQRLCANRILKLKNGAADANLTDASIPLDGHVAPLPDDLDELSNMSEADRERMRECMRERMNEMTAAYSKYKSTSDKR